MINRAGQDMAELNLRQTFVIKFVKFLFISGIFGWSFSLTFLKKVLVTTLHAPEKFNADSLFHSSYHRSMWQRHHYFYSQQTENWKNPMEIIV